MPDTGLVGAGEIHSCLVERALAMDGTCTEEHGVGMEGQIARGGTGVAVPVMRSIRRARPRNIMKSGKIFAMRSR